MSSDAPFKEALPDEEPRDYSRYLWAGVLLLFVLMIAALAFSGRRDPSASSVRARHILISYDHVSAADRSRALELANRLRQQILDGADFAALARDYSDDKASASRGGELPPVTRGELEPGFDAYVWTAEIGAISNVIETSYGFHIIQVLERHITAAEEYEAELDRKARELLEQRQRETTEKKP